MIGDHYQDLFLKLSVQSVREILHLGKIRKFQKPTTVTTMKKIERYTLLVEFSATITLISLSSRIVRVVLVEKWERKAKSGRR